MTEPVIFIVATPIGNLGDISTRALATLKNVDLIAAEDTRNTKKLLTHFQILGKELVSYHDHVEERMSLSLLDRLERDNLSLAIVSDAGTPCVADPGYRIVHLAKERGIKVHPIPGPSALTSLISASGLPSDRVLFVGFLPAKESEMLREIQSWVAVRASIVFFAPTRKLARDLQMIQEIYPNARVAIGRELTKLYEEIKTAHVAEAVEWIQGHPTLKGEAAVMVDVGVGDEPEDIETLKNKIRTEAKKGFSAGKSLKDLLKQFGHVGIARTDLYQLLLDVKAELR